MPTVNRDIHSAVKVVSDAPEVIISARRRGTSARATTGSATVTAMGWGITRMCSPMTPLKWLTATMTG